MLRRIILIVFAALGVEFSMSAESPSEPDQKSETTTMGANAQRFPADFPESCKSRVRIPPIPEEKSGYSVYWGYWPAVRVCQALVVRSSVPREKLPVIYAYEGNSIYPAGALEIREAHYADATKKLTFTLPWRGRPEVSYDLSSGQAHYKDSTGIYEGAIVLVEGTGLVPFGVK